MISERPDRLSLCVHGCNHTGGEFASTDVAYLTGLSDLALERMNSLSARFGVPYDKVMVFPQGVYSVEALRALDRTGCYLAASNSLILDKYDIALSLRIVDLLGIDIPQHQGFPLFMRRNPRDGFGLGLDAFFGRPLIIVEHHSFFRHGMARFDELIRRVTASCEGVRWKPLGDAVTSSGQYRQVRGTHWKARFATRMFMLQNPLQEQATIECEVRVAEAGGVTVLVDGKEIPHTTANGVVSLSLLVEANQSMKVSVERPEVGRARLRLRILLTIWSAIRLQLCRFRDNVLVRSAAGRLAIAMLRRR